MEITSEVLENMSKDLLDLTKDGWKREIYFDSSKLAEECGEVAECVNKSSKTTEDLGEELADVVAVCYVLAVKKGIDLGKAIEKKQAKRINKLLSKYHNGAFPKGFSLRVKI